MMLPLQGEGTKVGLSEPTIIGVAQTSNRTQPTLRECRVLFWVCQKVLVASLGMNFKA